MRFMLTFVSGVVVGYVLYGRKDQTIEQLVEKMHQSAEKLEGNVRTRVKNVSN